MEARLDIEVDKIIKQHIQEYVYYQDEVLELMDGLKIAEERAIQIVSKRYNQFIVN